MMTKLVTKAYGDQIGYLCMVIIGFGDQLPATYDEANGHCRNVISRNMMTSSDQFGHYKAHMVTKLVIIELIQ